MCFVDIKEAFDRAPKKVMEWAKMNKGLPEVTVGVMRSLCYKA